MTLATVWHVYDNYRTKWRSRRGRAETSSGSTHCRFDLEGSLQYIQNVYADYLSYAGLETADFNGKRILEVGPGDNFGVALQLLVAGARQVVCLDRFYSERNPEQQAKIYRAMRENFDEYDRARFDKAIRIEGDICLNGDTLKYLHGKGIEDAEEAFPRASFDFIISRAVLEHLYDCDAGFEVMDRLLAPGGWMMHKIDFRDHDLYSAYGFNPLTFLTISEKLYRRMSVDSGKPNRRLINYYRKKMKALGYATCIYVTHLAGQQEEIIPHIKLAENEIKPSSETLKLLKEIRPRLGPDYRQLHDEDLIIAGIFLVAQKPT